MGQRWRKAACQVQGGRSVRTDQWKPIHGQGDQQSELGEGPGDDRTFEEQEIHHQPGRPEQGVGQRGIQIMKHNCESHFGTSIVIADLPKTVV